LPRWAMCLWRWVEAAAPGPGCGVRDGGVRPMRQGSLPRGEDVLACPCPVDRSVAGPALSVQQRPPMLTGVGRGNCDPAVGSFGAGRDTCGGGVSSSRAYMVRGGFVRVTAAAGPGPVARRLGQADVDRIAALLSVGPARHRGARECLTLAASFQARRDCSDKVRKSNQEGSDVHTAQVGSDGLPMPPQSD
jgi:hypothetical protein